MTAKMKLAQTIKVSPNFWWFRPFYDSTLFQDGYRISYSYIGVMDDLDHCAEKIKEGIVRELEGITQEEFDNHPSFERQVPGGMTISFYVGGPGSGDPPPPPPPKGGG